MVGVDITAMDTYPGVFVHADIAKVPAAQLLELLGGPADLVLSDMAPHTVGDRFTDHVRQLALAELARDRALDLLSPGGHFVCKVFDGQDAHAFVQSLRPHFETLRRIKPEATRQTSREFFVLGLNRLDP